MELNLNKPTSKPAPAPENEALAAIMTLENELRTIMVNLKDEDPAEFNRRLSDLYKEQIQKLNKMMLVAQEHIARKMQHCGVPRKTGGEILSLAYDMANFSIAITARQLAAINSGLNIEEGSAPAKPEKEYSPIITEI